MSGSAFGAGSALSGGSCPCGSQRPYAGCCGPLLAADRQAVTAEELMRSRYTAFARGDVGHLVRTWHPRTRPDDLELDPSTRWTGLTVLRTERGGPQDTDGVVEFVARWREPSARGAVRTGELREVSRFTRRAGRWVYVDGDQA
ncbi:YchJ family metal-binding protein [Terrabacter sp. NPDC000476]|uniref:YchJ family protein n=1 Tax=Terrabacter sp. NPDC000476 TaxID=3154258 RepID=UPI0033265D6A